MKKFALLLALALICTVLVFSQNFGSGSNDDFGMGFGIDFSGGQINSNPAAEKAKAKADDAQDKMQGIIAMRFYNAVNRAPIQGATVLIPEIGSLTTNSVGRITFPKLPDGTYTLTFSKPGFITTDIDFRVLMGAVDFNWYSISPGIPDKDYRIVLDWAEKPADLDLHFEKAKSYHISYSNQREAEDGNAVLDRDDRYGYGPETITIGKIDLKAVYTCYVVDYTNRNNPKSVQMAKEGAIIRIYSNNKLVQQFRIPVNAAGTKWNVFRIDRGNFIPVNTVSAN